MSNPKTMKATRTQSTPRRYSPIMPERYRNANPSVHKSFSLCRHNLLLRAAQVIARCKRRAAGRDLGFGRVELDEELRRRRSGDRGLVELAFLCVDAIGNDGLNGVGCTYAHGDNATWR